MQDAPEKWFGSFCAYIKSMQAGKSSMMYKIKEYLCQKGGSGETENATQLHSYAPWIMYNRSEEKETK